MEVAGGSSDCPSLVRSNIHTARLRAQAQFIGDSDSLRRRHAVLNARELQFQNGLRLRSINTDGLRNGTRFNCFPPFVGLQAQKFGGVFINAYPRAGTWPTSPFDVLLTLRRFSYLEEKQFLSRSNDR